ncbi:MAG: transposase [Deltaproteobacteria bacterium]|nr:transposase [Deltaproteobacteria bacterium]
MRVRHVQGARPRSAIAKAIQYTLNQWAALALCADHPEIPIHNNTSELRLRQAFTGRKNYLFAGSEGGAASAATCTPSSRAAGCTGSNLGRTYTRRLGGSTTTQRRG